MQNINYYKDTNFQEKIQFYLIKAAIAIMTEEAVVEHHVKRVAFASRILHGGFRIDSFAIGVMTNVTVKTHIDAGTSYDDDLEFVVNSLFTAYAGGANIADPVEP